jgi:hypothetical protein
MEADRFKDEKGKSSKNLMNFLILSKLLNSDHKNDNVNNEKPQSESNSEEEIIDGKSSIENPKELGKNKWLNPTDEFGQLEKGVTVDSRTYARGTKENETTIFTII